MTEFLFTHANSARELVFEVPLHIDFGVVVPRVNVGD